MLQDLLEHRMRPAATSLLLAFWLAAPAGAATIRANTFGCDHIHTAELAWQVILTKDIDLFRAFLRDVDHGEHCHMFKGPRVDVAIPDENAGWTCVSEPGGKPYPNKDCWFVPTAAITDVNPPALHK